MSDQSGGRTITARYTSVDSTGQELKFTVPINGFIVFVEGGATAAFEGSATDANVADAQFSGALSWPVGGPKNRVLGTVKAIGAGTIDFSVFAWR